MVNLTIKQNNQQTEQVTSQIIDTLYKLAYEDEITNPKISATATDIIGSINAPAAYEDAVEFLRAKFPNLIINIVNNVFYVRFADSTVEQYCLTNYGDGVGVTKTALGAISGNNILNNIDKTAVYSLKDFQYFTGVDYSDVITGFSNAQEIKFPGIRFYNTTPYIRNTVLNTKNIAKIDYGNATFDGSIDLMLTGATGTNGGTAGNYIQPINGNDVITLWDKIFIPKQTDLSHCYLFFDWNKLNNIIFPEGITKTCDTFRRCSNLKYVEYPTTITSLGNLMEIGRDGSNNYVMVIKATTPPAAYYFPNNTEYNQGGWGWHKFPTAIYVPDSAVNTYKNVTPLTIGSDWFDQQLIWVDEQIKSRIRPLSELSVTLREYGTVTQEDIDRV